MDGDLDLSGLPPIYVLPTHITTEELADIETQLDKRNAKLTYDASEAKIFLGKIQRKRRAIFELHSRRIWTKDKADTAEPVDASIPPSKKQRTGSPSMPQRSSETAAGLDDLNKCTDVDSPSVVSRTGELRSITVKVVKLSWLDDLKNARDVLPLDNYIVYEGIVNTTPNPDVLDIPSPKTLTALRAVQTYADGTTAKALQSSVTAEDILNRAQRDGASSKPKVFRGRFHQRGADSRFTNQPFASTSQASHVRKSNNRPPLLHEETSEIEDTSNRDLPDMPDWVKSNSKYSCQRVTPIDNPNNDFIAQLKKIKLARLLTGDEIGVRAYSTSIAAIAAYPRRVISPREIVALPGCDVKIANLWVEWKENDGLIKASEEAENDETLKVLRLFYEIWGVGATTAREFYFERGWRDLDDIVEHGWSSISRVQQIGVKYYEEFMEKIPRTEVELIAGKIREHAIRVRGEGVETCVVGGYRRRKVESGDVDLIVSHRDPAMSLGIVKDIVASLESEGWITHTLLLSLNTTNRGQATLPYRTGGGGHGFDSLDKALVVWQNPYWEGKGENDAEANNPNVHRRVDIIISPWRTVGCAVMGWSGGTTFQRDLRRYAKHVKGWKFDSSGVRDRARGTIVDLEGDPDTKSSPEDAEKRVFEGLGLVYREPWERCTG